MTSSRRKPAATVQRRPGSEVSIRDLTPADLARIQVVLRQADCARSGRAGPAARFVPPERAVRAYARVHRAPLSAAAAAGGADLAVLAAHAAGGPYAYAGILAASAAAGGRVAWKHRRGARRRQRARRYAAVMWAASTATALAGTAAGMASSPGQAVMLGGGLAVAGPYLWHARKRPPQPRAAAEDPVPVLDPADPRIEAFRQRFCRSSGPCKNADLHSVRNIPDGFAFELTIDAAADATTRDVIALIPKIAGLYDVPADQVSVEYPPTRSERRACISVLTVANAFDREDRWDGESTYDPARGTIRISRYADSADAHWLLHKPGSGAASGVIAGVQGSGKTGTVLVVACEAGQAKLCTECGAARSCARCDPRRIVALWMADPQEQPLGVFRGRADLMAWGPLATVQMLIMMHAAMRALAGYFGTMTWTDHLGRENTGKGYFDPTPEYPLLLGIFDEWPVIIADPVLAKIAVPLAAGLLREGRKVGAALDLLVQLPDLTQFGDRVIRELLKAFNALSHRTDGLSKHMLGIQGDTAALAPGIHGLGYLNGPDGRPGATMRTKHLPEYLKPGETGIDAREIAGRIAADPVRLPGVVIDAITPLGYTGPGQVLDGSQLAAAIALVAADAKSRRPAGLTVEDALRKVVAGDTSPAPAGTEALPGATARAPSPAGPPLLPADPVSLPLLAAVLAQRGEMDLWDVSEAAGCDALEADQALGELAAAGLAVQTAPGRYRSLAGPADPDPLPGTAASTPSPESGKRGSMNDTEEDPVVTRILEQGTARFLARMSGTYNPAAPPADQWAQAAAAAIVAGPRERPGHVTAIRAWLGQAATDDDLRFRRVALATLCDHLPVLRPGDVASMRADPDIFLAAADGYFRLGEPQQDPGRAVL